jgi:hypothetical protein
MLRSPAWRALSLSARRVLDRIEIELADHGGTDNGKLPVTYDDFVRYGIERHAIRPAIREVIALGFVEITETGRAGNAEWRKPNLFRLNFRNAKYAPTDEWQKITEEQAELIARTARIAPQNRCQPKIKSQCGKKPNPSAGNPHRKRQIHSGESHTTGHSGETHTTLDISGQVGQEAKPEAVRVHDTGAGTAPGAATPVQSENQQRQRQQDAKKAEQDLVEMIIVLRGSSAMPRPTRIGNAICKTTARQGGRSRRSIEDCGF